jgi:hypothetical protein
MRFNLFREGANVPGLVFEVPLLNVVNIVLQLFEVVIDDIKDSLLRLSQSIDCNFQLVVDFISQFPEPLVLVSELVSLNRVG